MSKILQKGDTGFGILIERDAGFISPDINQHILKEGFEIKPNEPILINCVLQKWGVKNKNGRIYPKEVLVPQVELYQESVGSNSSVSEADHPECVQSVGSQILTKDGWKSFDEISDSEEVLTLNTNTNEIEIQRITEKIYEPYKGKMYRFTSRNMDITVTPNHRFLLENRKGDRFYVLAKDIYEDKSYFDGSYKMLKLGDWKGEYSEYVVLDGMNPENLGFNIRKDLLEEYTKPIKIKSEDWFAFMGIYLADGHSTGTMKGEYGLSGYEVGITVSKEKNKKKIKELIDKLPFPNKKIYTNKNGKSQHIITDARLYDYLFKLGHSHTKYIPTEVKSASSDLLETFFEWFMIGDGRSIELEGELENYKSVFSTSEKLINDLHEVLVKIGGSGNITTYQPIDRYINDIKYVEKEVEVDGKTLIIEEEVKIPRLIEAKNSNLQYNLNISKTKNIWLDKRCVKIEEIDFDDIVASVKVPNTNYMVKVNGKSHWTGNSTIISLHNLSHLITKMWWGKGKDENVLYGQLKLIVTRGYINYGIASVIGDKILLYLENKIRIGISSRGVGSLKEINGENIVQNDFELVGFDLVSTPSTPGAYLFPQMDGTDTKFNENIYKSPSLNMNETKIVDTINKFLL